MFVANVTINVVQHMQYMITLSLTLDKTIITIITMLYFTETDIPKENMAQPMGIPTHPTYLNSIVIGLHYLLSPGFYVTS